MTNDSFSKMPFFTSFLLWCVIIGKFALPTFLIMFPLKLMSIITWSWWIVFLPMYYFIPILVVGFLLDVLLMYLKRNK